MPVAAPDEGERQSVLERLASIVRGFPMNDLQTYLALDREARSLGGRIGKSTGEARATLERRLAVVRLRLFILNTLNAAQVVLSDDEVAEVTGTLRGAA